MKLSTEAAPLQHYLDALTTVTDETKIHATPDGLETDAVDAAHILMVSATLSSANMYGYQADNETLGVDADKLSEALGQADPDDTVELWTDAGALHLEYGNLHRRMRLVDTDNMADPKIPSLDLDAELNVPLDQFKQGIDAALTVNDTLRLKTAGNAFIMGADNDMDEVKLTLREGTLGPTDWTDNHSALYSTGQLMNIRKAAPLVNTVNLQFTTDHPVRVAWDTEDLDVAFLLAPRIEGD